MKKLLAACLASTLLALLLGATVVPPARADMTFTVNSSLDEADAAVGDGNCVSTPSGVCTLRAAIQEANALGGNDTIVLPVGTFMLSGAGDDTAATGDLDITSNLTINGSSASGTIVVGSGTDRVFHIVNGSTVTLANLTVRAGSLAGDGGGIYMSGGSLTLNNVNVGDPNAMVGNSATGSGRGGGIYQAGGSLTINFSTVAYNTAGGNGGGIYVAGGSLTLNNSTLGPSNGGVAGGGIYVPGGVTATINNSTISGNTASGGGVTDGGGGVFSSGNTNLNSVTVAVNSTSAGGGGVLQLGGTVNLRNSLVGTNSATASGPDCSGTMSSQGYNLVRNADGCNGVFNGVNGDLAGNGVSPLDPEINGLANNGGPTHTHGLQSDSPAIDAGNPGGCGSGGGSFGNDQRGAGFPRQVDGNVDGMPRCDIGAIEAGPIGSTVTPSMTFTPSETPTPTVTETSAPSETPTLTLTSGPSPSATFTPTFTPVAGGKLPGVTISPVVSGGGGGGGGGGVSASQTMSVLQTQANFTPTPSATQSESDMTSTDVALTANAQPGAAFATPTLIPTITPTFSLPAEDVSLSTSRIVGVEGGVVTCGIWFIEVSAVTVPDNTVFQCETISPEDEASASVPLNHRAIWHIIEVKARDPGGQALTRFNPPLRVCAYYADSQLDVVDGDPSRFVIYTTESIGRRWVALTTTAQEGVPRVCAESDQLSLFRLVAQPSALVGRFTSLPALAILAGGCCLLLLVVIVIGVIVARRTRRTPPAEAPAAT